VRVQSREVIAARPGEGKPFPTRLENPL